MRFSVAKRHSVLLLFGLFYFVANVSHAGSRGNLRKKMDGNKISAVEILDSAGKVVEEIATGANDFARGSRKYRRLIRALEAGQDGSLVVVDTMMDLDERNPYKVVRSSTTRIRWLDPSGGSRCELAGGGRTGVIAVSTNGKHMAVLHAGFDPIEFEKFNEGAEGNSLERLRSDTELTMNRLEIFNARCERIWSAAGGVSDFGNVAFSPSGKWLLYRVHHRSNDPTVRAKRKFNAVDLDGKGKFEFLSDKTPPNIADDGTVEALEQVGKGSGFRTIKSKVYEFKFDARPDDASVPQAVSCRGQWGTVEFLDAKGRTLKSFTNKEHRERKGNSGIYDLVNVYGCLKGRFAYVVRQYGRCPLDSDDCENGEEHATLEIYDHTGKRILNEDISISNTEDISVARSDERVLVTPRSPPYGVMVVEPTGIKKVITFEGKGGRLFPNAISPSGRYGVAMIGGNFEFFDTVTGKTHTYKGPGDPWVNDEGKFEVWVGSSLKNDWSLGPDGKKVYEFKFE